MRNLVAALLTLSFAAQLDAATRTWTGAAGNNWTTASNWTEGSAPVAGDDLVFPANGANQSTANNDFPNGTLFNSIFFSGGSYTLSGNSIVLGRGGVDVNNGVHRISMPVTLAAAQTWVLNRDSFGVSVNDGIDLNGMALAITGEGNFAPSVRSISGAGSILLSGLTSGLNLQGASTSTAPFIITSGAAFLHNAYPGPFIVEDGGELSIDPGATAGPISVSGVFSELQPGFLFGTGNSGSVSLAAGSKFTVVTREGQFNSLNVTGTIDLEGADLNLSTGNTLIPAGTKLTIINNDSTDPVTGTFRGLPEGAEVVSEFDTPQIFSVSYTGGTGNDVVLTAMGPATETNMELTSSANPSSPRASITLTARVTATSGTAVPTGSIEFTEFIAPNTIRKLATVPLDSTGTATFTTSDLEAGLHFLEAEYSYNNPPFAPNVAFVDQTVTESARRHAARP